MFLRYFTSCLLNSCLLLLDAIVIEVVRTVQDSASVLSILDSLVADQLLQKLTSSSSISIDCDIRKLLEPIRFSSRLRRSSNTLEVRFSRALVAAFSSLVSLGSTLYLLNSIYKKKTNTLLIILSFRLPRSNYCQRLSKYRTFGNFYQTTRLISSTLIPILRAVVVTII